MIIFFWVFSFIFVNCFACLIKSFCRFQTYFKFEIFSFPAEPLPLMDLCRRVIRQNINKERIEQGKIEELNLPNTTAPIC